jgi:hypothetical protein
MQELSWINHIPGESLEGGIALLNDLRWNIRSGQSPKGAWLVMAGHCVIFKTDSKQAVDAFLYGMSLSYAVMKKELLAEHRLHMLKESGIDADNPPLEHS